MTTLSRRHVLAGSAAGVAIASLPRSAFAAKQTDVIVIGGGLAGLNAALNLSDYGARPIVLEAASRVGGRCFTADGVEGRPEYGASQIGASYARVRDVANRFNIALAPGANVNAPLCFGIGGKLVSRQDWASSPLNRTVGDERHVTPQALTDYYLRKKLPWTEIDGWRTEAARAYDIPLGKWLISLGASAEAIRLMNSGLVDPNVADVSALSILHEYIYTLMEIESFADPTLDRFEAFSKISSRVVDGTSRIPEAMAAHLGDSVHLNKQVATIDLSARGVEVRCTDGTSYKGSYVVSAVPFTALRKIDIRPGLPGAIGAAVKGIGAQRQSQIFMQTDAPYWEEDGLDASIWTDTGPVSLIRQQIGGNGERRLLTAIANGDKGTALDQMPKKQRAQHVVDFLGQLRPAMKGHLKVIAVQSWAEQPFIYGCRHWLQPGEVKAFRDAIERPYQRMHFAGEHVRRLAIGMEAAMESGEAAAIQILERG